MIPSLQSTSSQASIHFDLQQPLKTQLSSIVPHSQVQFHKPMQQTNQIPQQASKALEKSFDTIRVKQEPL
jgi:hypothetical protein